MMMPGNVVKFYKKEVLENLEDCESAKHVAIWYQKVKIPFDHNIICTIRWFTLYACTHKNQ